MNMSQSPEGCQRGLPALKGGNPWPLQVRQESPVPSGLMVHMS
jgi:hypothetical protein